MYISNTAPRFCGTVKDVQINLILAAQAYASSQRMDNGQSRYSYHHGFHDGLLTGHLLSAVLDEAFPDYVANSPQLNQQSVTLPDNFTGKSKSTSLAALLQDPAIPHNNPQAIKSDGHPFMRQLIHLIGNFRPPQEYEGLAAALMEKFYPSILPKS